MRSRLLWIVALTVLAGCRVEGGDRQAARRPAAGEDSTAAGGEQQAPLGHRVFNRKTETVAPGVVRVTLSTVVPIQFGQDSARTTLENLLTAERQRDSTVAAVRILAYLPPAEGHGAQQAPLVPLAFLDWVPAAGWDSLAAATARQPHRATTTFVHDAETMGMMRGAPSHPSPRRPQ